MIYKVIHNTENPLKRIYKKCNNLQKQILGFCSIPPINEKLRINTKSGYNILKK